MSKRNKHEDNNNHVGKQRTTLQAENYMGKCVGGSHQFSIFSYSVKKKLKNLELYAIFEVHKTC